MSLDPYGLLLKLLNTNRLNVLTQAALNCKLHQATSDPCRSKTPAYEKDSSNETLGGRRDAETDRTHYNLKSERFFGMVHI
jgi:hypothetical protein